MQMVQRDSFDVLPIIINVLDHDRQGGRRNVIVKNYVDPLHGHLNFNAFTGEFSYMPYDSSHCYRDLFSYMITDGVRSEIIHVVIEDGHAHHAAQSQDGMFIVPKNDSLSFFIQEGITDNIACDHDKMEVVNYVDPQHGTVAYHSVSGEFIYVPNSEYQGDDCFDFTVTDGVNFDVISIKVRVSPVSFLASKEANMVVPRDRSLKVNVDELLLRNRDDQVAEDEQTLSAQLYYDINDEIVVRQ